MKLFKCLALLAAVVLVAGTASATILTFGSDRVFSAHRYYGLNYDPPTKDWWNGPPIPFNHGTLGYHQYGDNVTALTDAVGSYDVGAEGWTPNITVDYGTAAGAAKDVQGSGNFNHVNAYVYNDYQSGFGDFDAVLNAYDAEGSNPEVRFRLNESGVYHPQLYSL
jgi:hypothetical protein